MKIEDIKKIADNVENLSKRFDARVARKDADFKELSHPRSEDGKFGSGGGGGGGKTGAHPKVTAIRKYVEGVEGNLAGKSLSELTAIRKELWDKEREASSGEDGSVMNAVQKATKSANKAVEVALSKARGEGGKVGREVQRPRPRTGKYR